jgi:hypothetical protein
MAAAAHFAKIANFANSRCESSLTPPMIHSKRAENKDILPFSPYLLPIK